jgi:opacity protein-like surface antigen
MKHLCFVLLLAASFPAMAQHGDMGNFFPSITHELGGSFQKFDGLNSRIATLPQYKQLPAYASMLELGWFKQQRQFIMTGGFTAASSMGADHDKRSSTIRFLGVHADLGYDVLNSSRVMLYPMVGLGLEKYQARFFKDNSSVAFDDLISSPTVQNDIRSLDLTNGFFNYRLGLGVGFKSPKYPSNSIGIQVGYSGSFKSNPWKSNQNQTLAGAPEDKVSRFSVGIILIGRPGSMKQGSMKHE